MRSCTALTIDDIVVEEGVSGSVPVMERPKGGKLFARLDQGRHRDRAPSSTACSDRPRRPARWSRICASAAFALHLLDLGGDISGNGLSKLFLTIAAAFRGGRARSDPRAGLAIKADQKARGRYLGGIVPFGFRRGESGELVPHEGEQQAIREMAALRAQGRPLRAIAEAVRAKGHKIRTRA